MQSKIFGESLSTTNRIRMFNEAKSTIVDLMNVMWNIHAKKAGSGDAEMLALLTEAQNLLVQVREKLELAKEAALRE
jgi:50S ribosomal subunit-associated GTPase HflX